MVERDISYYLYSFRNNNVCKLNAMVKEVMFVFDKFFYLSIAPL